MPKIIIYKTNICPYCINAKNLLLSKGIKNNQIEEIDISSDQEKLAEMMLKSGGRRTVPQIFINDEHIGGFDDLNLLNNQGKLDSKLQ